MSDPEHDGEWRQFKLRYPEFFYRYEQPREYQDLQDLLAYYGPQIAAVMAESLRARQKAEDIQRNFISSWECVRGWELLAWPV